MNNETTFTEKDAIVCYAWIMRNNKKYIDAMKKAFRAWKRNADAEKELDEFFEAIEREEKPCNENLDWLVNYVCTVKSDEMESLYQEVVKQIKSEEEVTGEIPAYETTTAKQYILNTLYKDWHKAGVFKYTDPDYEEWALDQESEEEEEKDPEYIKWLEKNAEKAKILNEVGGRLHDWVC